MTSLLFRLVPQRSPNACHLSGMMEHLIPGGFEFTLCNIARDLFQGVYKLDASDRLKERVTAV